MCGICGIISRDLSKKQRIDAVQTMSRTMEHRGPDDYGIEDLDSICCLGMRRLSIIDLTQAAHQPMCNEDDTLWIVLNGEIYNFKEIRKSLIQKGHVFKSESDTEVILHLYEDHGQEFIHKLRGMFAFALWDSGKRELLIYRDRLGIKPLYYVMPTGGFLFASDIKSILSCGIIDAELNYKALDLYLSFGYVPPPLTIVKNVYTLMPGHCIRFKDFQLSDTKWWVFPEEGSNKCDMGIIIPRTRYLLEESIRLHQISDVPIGAFLSGGIDSTAMVALMSQVTHQSIKTISIGFEKNIPGKFNELSYAKLVSNRFQTDHTETILTGKDVADELESIILHIDQPSYDGINSYFVSRAAKQAGLTVALSGLGGDELFGGYGSYQIIPYLSNFTKHWSTIPDSIKTSIIKMFQVAGKIFLNNDRSLKISRLKFINSPVSLYALARFNLWPLEKRELFSDQLAEKLALDDNFDHSLEILEKYACNDGSIWRMITNLELQTYMNWRLLRDTDVMSMAHSIEVRVPLIDHKIVEFICGLPYGWQKQLGYPKRLLTAALSEFIPEEVRKRPKHGFEFPLGWWMKRELKEIVDDTLSYDSVKSRGLFCPDRINSLYKDFLNGKHPYPVLWQMVVLELWIRQMIDK